MAEGGLSPSPVGVPLAAESTVRVGPGGGTVRSDDGRVEVVIPQGALAQSVAITVQSLTATAPGALGDAVRLQKPGDVMFAVPVTVRFLLTPFEVGGVDPSDWRIGYQRADGYWVMRQATYDATMRAVSTETTHFSDWALSPAISLRPGNASVRVGAQLELNLVHCELVRADGQGLCQPGLEECLAQQCRSATLRASEISGWAVNTIPGGDSKVGTVVSRGATAVFTAPETEPDPATVHVSVTLVKGNVYRTLLSSVTITGKAAYVAYVRLFGLTPDKVDGEADVLFERIENLADVERYKATQARIKISAQPSNCDRVDDISIPFDPASNSTLIIYKANSAYGSMHSWVLIMQPQPIVFQCGMPRHAETRYVSANVTVATMQPFSKLASLRGRAAQPGGSGHYAWWMDRVRE